MSSKHWIIVNVLTSSENIIRALSCYISIMSWPGEFLFLFLFFFPNEADFTSNSPWNVPTFLVTLTLTMCRLLWISQRKGSGRGTFVCLQVRKYAKWMILFTLWGEFSRINTLKARCPFYGEEKTYCSLLNGDFSLSILGSFPDKLGHVS